MAFSRSTQKAQTLSVCQFCEESSEIKQKCINCNLFLCQLCNSRIHSKSEASREHQVINLQECGTEDACETMRKVDLQRLECTNHLEQKCFVYCTDCEQPVCAQCLITSHKNHELKQLEDVYKTKLDELRTTKSKIKSNLSFFNKEEDKLKQLLTEGDKKYVETKNKILQQEKQIKEAATKHAQGLKKELDSQWKPTETEIKKELAEVAMKKDELQITKENIEQALQSHQASDIISVSCQSLGNTFPENSVPQIKIQHTKYIPEHTPKQSKGESFGQLYKVPELELINTYQTDLRSLEKILHFEHNSFFISDYPSGILKKVLLYNGEFKVEKEVKVQMYDMAIMTNGHILISDDESSLKLYTKDKIYIFKQFSPLFTLGVHVNEHNEILVGLTDSVSLDIPTRYSVRKIIVLNQYGDLQHSYEFDRDNQRFFTRPRRICTYKDNICVVDLLNDKLEGRVVVLNKGGQLQWDYNGYDSVNSDNRFTPIDMSILNTSNIVISDSNNHAIHVLNQKGEIIICSVVKDLGIELPLSLCIDTNRILWIGCNTNGDDKAKLHCLKIT